LQARQRLASAEVGFGCCHLVKPHEPTWCNVGKKTEYRLKKTVLISEELISFMLAHEIIPDENAVEE